MAALAVLVAAVVPLLVTAFAWPALRTAPREVPLVVAGPGALAAPAAEALTASQPGAFDIEVAATPEAARAKILDRRAYGAVLLGPNGPEEVLVASAASPTVAQLLTEAATRIPGGAGRPGGDAEAPRVRVTDVAPTPAEDPRGAGLAAAALPLTLAGVLTGALLSLRIRGAGRRLGGAVLTAALVGPGVVAVLHGWLGGLDGPVVAEAGVVALGVLAGGLVVLGAKALFGTVGLGLAAATLVLLGNPLSGATSAPHLLPTGWSTLGQALPPGALVSALRGVSGFDGAGTAGPLLVLAAWALAGSAAVLGAAVLSRRRATSGRTASGAP
ncbi:MAG: hypothetical protein ACFCVG_19325, partial [Kineosporiaceae bacterium]